MDLCKRSVGSNKFAFILITISGIIGLTCTIVSSSVFAQPNPNNAAEKSSVSQPHQNIITIADLPESPGPGYLPTANGEWIPIDVVGTAQPLSIAPSTIAPTVGRKNFYLTALNFTPIQALTACGAGYHMASLWEILNVTNLVYEYDNPAAYTKADSGYGPPSLWYGWVRTGSDSSGSSIPGSGNCLNWTSADGANSGSIVRLSNTWATAPGDIFTWDVASFTCLGIGPVWCVRD